MGELVRNLAVAAVVVMAPSVAAPAAAPAAPPSTLGPLHQIVWQAAADQGVSYSLLNCLVTAESEYDPRAVSPTQDYGLAQWHRPWDPGSLWQATPWAGADPFDPTANVEAAGWAIARGFGPRWSTWRFCA